MDILVHQPMDDQQSIFPETKIIGTQCELNNWRLWKKMRKINLLVGEIFDVRYNRPRLVARFVVLR